MITRPAQLARPATLLTLLAVGAPLVSGCDDNSLCFDTGDCYPLETDYAFFIRWVFFVGLVALCGAMFVVARQDGEGRASLLAFFVIAFFGFWLYPGLERPSVSSQREAEAFHAIHLEQHVYPASAQPPKEHTP